MRTGVCKDKIVSEMLQKIRCHPEGRLWSRARQRIPTIESRSSENVLLSD